MLPLWILKKGLGAVFMVVRLVLGVLRLVFGRRLIALAVLVGGFFLGKKFLKDKTETDTKPE
jgi:uncharacterized membrane protein